MNSNRVPSRERPDRGVPRRAVLLGAAAAVTGAGALTSTAGEAEASGVQNGRAAPDFGPNVVVFDPSMPREQIQASLDEAFALQESAEFGEQRFAFLFRPGSYVDIDANIGFYTHVAGLGRSPDDVDITGWVRVEADWFDGNATHNFWRSAENLSVTPWDGYNRWAVSQAAPIRRVHVRGEMPLWNGYDGWASGGFMADCQVDRVVSGSQQQWLTRNSELGEWAGSVWNMVFVGVAGAPPHHFPEPSHTVIDRAPVVREKPFLYTDDAGAFQVFVPALRNDARGTTWTGGSQPGASRPIERFHIVQPGATAAQINAALDAGQDLLFTPGIYHLDEAITVTRPGTVVLGLGLATLIPDTGDTALSVADVDGVRVAGLLIDAGESNSDTLMVVGPDGPGAAHAADPICLHDVFFRIGGAHVGRATTSLVINSHHTIGDNVWLWRGDHGDGVGWTTNTADTGLIVNGDDVTIYGLFAEHYQKHNVIWNGNGGRTYFFQNELPYDPPDQASWMNGQTRGYAAYKVADTVDSHEAWGLGSYCLFLEDSSIVAERSFEVPESPNVNFHSMVIVSLGNVGTINHVINDTGGPVTPDNEGIDYLAGYP